MNSGVAVRSRGIFASWWWMWMIHAVLVGIMYIYFFLSRIVWFHFGYPAVSLTHEMNYAVWWSGICLFLAGLVFFRVAELDDDKRMAWAILGVACVALCIDEIGSLHESIARAGGWIALAPFALVFGAMFSWSVFQLVQDRRTIWPGILVILGVGIFVAVAGLEFVEHNIILWNHFLQKLRLVGEEAIELLGMSLLVMAGLTAYRRLRFDIPITNDPGLISIAAVLDRGIKAPALAYVLFASQIVLACGVIIPNADFFTEGNILSLFPILMFFCLGLYCLHYARSVPNESGWKVLGWIMVLVSLLQIFELYRLINKLLLFKMGYKGAAFMPPALWWFMLIPMLLVMKKGVKLARFRWRAVVGHVLIVVFVLAMCLPELENRGREEFLFFLFASFVAFSCYLLIRRITVPPE